MKNYNVTNNCLTSVTLIKGINFAHSYLMPDTGFNIKYPNYEAN